MTVNLEHVRRQFDAWLSQVPPDEDLTERLHVTTGAFQFRVERPQHYELVVRKPI